MKSYAKLIAILLLPLAFVLWHAQSDVQLPPPGWKLSKLSLPRLAMDAAEEAPAIDSIRHEEQTAPDTTAQRILFFGDSMVEGLLLRMDGYAHANGYSLTNVIWYGSTTETWAETDTLRHFMSLTQPTFVMISIGGNEQFVKDLTRRETCIRQIVRQMGQTPFVWIGTPAWKEDTGINALTRQIVGDRRYFDSRGLDLKRGSDHMHPTFGAASLWMDSVATWMESPATAHPIRMNRPTETTGKRHSRTYALQPL